MRIGIEDGITRVCFNCLQKIIVETKNEKIKYYNGHALKLVPVDKCDFCNKLNQIKIVINEHPEEFN
jgi:hypothetical protein